MAKHIALGPPSGLMSVLIKPGCTKLALMPFEQARELDLVESYERRLRTGVVGIVIKDLKSTTNLPLASCPDRRQRTAGNA